MTICLCDETHGFSTDDMRYFLGTHKPKEEEECKNKYPSNRPIKFKLPNNADEKLYLTTCMPSSKECTNSAETGSNDLALGSRSSHAFGIRNCQIILETDPEASAIEDQTQPRMDTPQEGNQLQCDQWAADGECATNAEYMQAECKASCEANSGAAEGAVLEAGHQAQARPECRDMDEGCQDWAAQGECEANASFMAESCPVSCGGCQPCADKTEVKFI